LAEWIGDTQTHHSASLLAGIDSCLKKAALTAKDIRWISIGVGSGMFTGLRVGVSTAKFMAEALACPVVPVSSLLAIAWRAKQMGIQAERLWALSDARSQRVYALPFTLASLSPLRKSPPEEAVAITPSELLPQLKPNDYLVGEGAKIYQEAWPKSVNLPNEQQYFQISASAIGEIGWALKQNGQEISPLELQPSYLKTGQNHLP
jgi:tRNA threonylcarbamoyladenosine biosynthesis protein TsaB